MDVPSIRGIEVSSTYQAIFRKGLAKELADARAEAVTEGRLYEARDLILRLGTKKLGMVSENVREEIIQLEDLSRLHSLQEGILDVVTWGAPLAPGAISE